MPPPNRRRRSRQKNSTAYMTADERRAHELQTRMDLSLAEAGISVRSVNGLEDRGIHDVRTLLQQDRQQLLAIANLGTKTIKELVVAVSGLGLPVPESWTAPMPKSRS